MRARVPTWLLVAAILVLLMGAYVVGARSAAGGASFAGADGQATTAIQEAHPGYVAWFHPFFEPGSPEVESGLFATQAGLGGLALGYCLGRLRGRRATTPTAPTAPTGTPASPQP